MNCTKIFVNGWLSPCSLRTHHVANSSPKNGFANFWLCPPTALRANSKSYRVISSIVFFLLATAISYGAEGDKVETSSFPIWGWFVIVGIIVGIYVCYRYSQYLWQEFNYDLTSKYSLWLSIIPLILFLGYFGGKIEMQILGMNAFLFLLILTILTFYIFNAIKTNWTLAIVNVFLQITWIPVLITAIVEHFTSGRASSTQSTSSNNRQLRDSAKTESQVNKESTSKKQQKAVKYYCKWCGFESPSLNGLTFAHCKHNPYGDKHELYEGGEKSEYVCKYCGHKKPNLRSLCSGVCNRSSDGRHHPAL